MDRHRDRKIDRDTDIKKKLWGWRSKGILHKGT